MDSKIMDLIDIVVKGFPAPAKSIESRMRQYEAAKKRLDRKFSGHSEIEYAHKAAARKYRI